MDTVTEETRKPSTEINHTGTLHTLQLMRSQAASVLFQLRCVHCTVSLNEAVFIPLVTSCQFGALAGKTPREHEDVFRCSVSQ